MLYGLKPDYCCNEMEIAVVQGEKSFNVCNGGKTWECRKQMRGANTSCWGPFGKFTSGYFSLHLLQCVQRHLQCADSSSQIKILVIQLHLTNIGLNIPIHLS